jgi:O-Antigen ligase
MLPGLLTAFTAFRAGGFFAGTQGALAAGVAVLVALRMLLARDPLAGASRALVVAAGALGLFAVWILVSSSWSHAPSRATIEFDRALLYLLVLVLFGTFPMTSSRLRWMLRGLALAAVAVCAVGFVSRVLPDVLPNAGQEARLAYPVTYSNALGLLGSLGAILCLHLTSSGREPRLVRVLAAAATPLLASTVYLTFSRGGIGAGVIGLVVYVVLAWPRLIVTGLASTVPTAAGAVMTAYGAPALASGTATEAAVISQGHHVARAVFVWALVAAATRAVLLLVDDLIARRQRWLPKPVAVTTAATMAAGALVAFVLVGGHGYLHRQYDRFLHNPTTQASADLRNRLLDPSSTGRVDFWRVARSGFRTQPLRGHGAGTYQEVWNRNRPYEFQLFDAHSLYLESLAELGVIGFALLATSLLTLLVGMARRMRGHNRSLFAAILVVTATWALRAGVDWDWEMPVLTLWVFAIGGAVLATPIRRTRQAVADAPQPPTRAGWTLRAAAGIGCLVLAVTPALVAMSQEHLNRSVSAFERNDCNGTAREAFASINALDIRPEPYQLLSYCDARAGLSTLAVREMRYAVKLDPGNWEYRYTLAVVRGVARLDPRPDARRALALNPRESLAREAVKRFATADPRLWRVRAMTAPLPWTTGTG